MSELSDKITASRDAIAAALEAGSKATALDGMEKAIDVFEVEVLCEDEDWENLEVFIKVGLILTHKSADLQDVCSWTMSSDRMDTLEMIADIASRYSICPANRMS